MEDNFDLEQFRLDSSKQATSQNSKARWRYQTKKGELFLRGPIPLWWINAASSLPGSSLSVGIRLWVLVGLHGSPQVKLNQSGLMMMGISRDAARRGLAGLETAGLVTVNRASGRCPIVTIYLKRLQRRMWSARSMLRPLKASQKPSNRLRRSVAMCFALPRIIDRLTRLAAAA